MARRSSAKKLPVTYEHDEEGTYLIRRVFDDEEDVEKVSKVPLANFRAQIVRVVTFNNGVEEEKWFRMRATYRHAGVRREHEFSVQASKFASISWALEELGPAAIVYPGLANKDHLRAAIQIDSEGAEHVTVYRHTGWVKFRGSWVFLHSNGSVPNEDVETELTGNLALVSLPALAGLPPAKITQAIRNSVAALHAGRIDVTAPQWAAIWRVVLGPCDFGLHVYGKTGVFKTAYASVMQAHFGAGFNERRVPTNWASTPNAIEEILFQGKDALVIIDDFVTKGGQQDTERQNLAADRVFRSQGNRSGRNRMQAEGGLRAEHAPQGLPLSTGEELPRGVSLRARIGTVHVTPGAIKRTALSIAQHRAAEGTFALALAAFIDWVAPHYEEILARLPAEREKLRTRLRVGPHERTRGIVADLALGCSYFLDFARSYGAFPAKGAQQLWERVWAGLQEFALNQPATIGTEEPALMFTVHLGSALSMGRCHLTTEDGTPPENATALGWQATENMNEFGTSVRWIPRGDRVGWVGRDGEIYVDPEAAFSIVNRIARDAGNPIPSSPESLRKRLFEGGYLVSRDQKRETLTVRRTLGGAQRDVLHFAKDRLGLSPPKRPDEPDIVTGAGGLWNARWAVPLSGMSGKNQGGPP